MIALGGLVVSLLAGIALAVAADYLNQKIWTQAEIESLLQEWLRIRVADDDKQRAEALMRDTKTDEGAVFLVRMD